MHRLEECKHHRFFFVFPTKEMLQLNSPKKFNLLPETPCTSLSDVNKLGLPIFLHVSSFMIVISDPVSSCNFIFTLLICKKKKNFLFCDVLLISLLGFLYLLRIFILFTYVFLFSIFCICNTYFCVLISHIHNIFCSRRNNHF